MRMQPQPSRRKCRREGTFPTAGLNLSFKFRKLTLPKGHHEGWSHAGRLLAARGGRSVPFKPTIGGERAPVFLDREISHVSSLCPADIGSVGREVVGGFLLNLLWKWRDGGEEGNDQVLTATSRALQGYRDELLSRRVVPAGEIAQMRRTMQLVARGRAIERKRLAMLAGEESAAEEGAEGEAPCVSWRGCSHVYNNQTMNTTQSYYDRYDRYRRFRTRTRITQTRILNGLAPASTRGDSTSTLLPPTHEKMARTSACRTRVTMLLLPYESPAPQRRGFPPKQHLHFGTPTASK